MEEVAKGIRDCTQRITDRNDKIANGAGLLNQGDECECDQDEHPDLLDHGSYLGTEALPKQGQRKPTGTPPVGKHSRVSHTLGGPLLRLVG